MDTHGKTITRHFTDRMRADLAFERIEQNIKSAENRANHEHSSVGAFVLPRHAKRKKDQRLHQTSTTQRRALNS